MNGIELLVHAGAPTSRIDDERYIAQAREYSGFEGDRVEHDANQYASTADGETVCSPERARATAGLDQPTYSRQLDHSILLQDTQLATVALESQLFTSSLCIPATISAAKRTITGALRGERNDLQHARDEAAELQAVKRSRIAPPVWLSDDFAAYDLGLRPFVLVKGNSSVSRISTTQLPDEEAFSDDFDPTGSIPMQRPAQQSMETPSKVVNGPDEQPTPGDKDGAEDVEHHTEPHTPSQRYGLHDSGPHRDDADDQTSELPTSYSLSDITSKNSKDKSQDSRSSEKLGQRMEEARSQIVDQPAAGGPCDPLIEVVDPAKPTPYPPQPTGAAARAERASSTSNTTMENPLLSTLNALPVLVRAPHPVTSTEPFATHVTPSLAFLIKNSDLSNSYRPVATRREVRISERGHWLLTASALAAWPLQLQIDFWDFLDNFIKQGNAGWGVWCTHEDMNVGQASLGNLKVFCWGEVIQHVYFLLYVASKSKVRKAGAQWVDAEGKVVVQMRNA